MTEINEYPWCKHGINKTGYCADCKVASLITTIESQQRDIQRIESENKGYLHNLKLKRDEIESQKEEIEKLKEEIRMSLKNGSCEACHVIMHENESLKAITELAVKGLNEIRATSFSSNTTLNRMLEMDRIARSTVSKIERLQNE